MAFPGGPEQAMFFFSNRLGCLKSVAISLLATVVLLALFGVIKLLSL